MYFFLFNLIFKLKNNFLRFTSFQFCTEFFFSLHIVSIKELFKNNMCTIFYETTCICDILLFEMFNLICLNLTITFNLF